MIGICVDNCRVSLNAGFPLRYEMNVSMIITTFAIGGPAPDFERCGRDGTPISPGERSCAVGAPFRKAVLA